MHDDDQVRAIAKVVEFIKALRCRGPEAVRRAWREARDDPSAAVALEQVVRAMAEGEPFRHEGEPGPKAR